ncbi:class I SAM-dependent methyltransferase [Halovivax sp.]|uniref:class I SAM-dependent methyltransferase n=1 Tax=Halovivax sp. TaxID=1935978 RepID=UPI0025C65275|nr:methyltransferase domain-containing protein [Halovivax sp.]
MWGPGDVGFFDRVAPLYDLVHPDPDPETMRAAFDPSEREVRTVLDVAGGSGRVARAIDAETVVVDVSRGMLARVDGPAVLGDAGTLPVSDDAVDAAICVDALHHLPEPGAALAELARVVKPGGVVAVVDFDPGTVRGRLVALGERAVGMDSTLHGPDEVAELLAAAGVDAAVRQRGFVSVVSGIVE